MTQSEVPDRNDFDTRSDSRERTDRFDRQIAAALASGIELPLSDTHRETAAEVRRLTGSTAVALSMLTIPTPPAAWNLRDGRRVRWPLTVLAMLLAAGVVVMRLTSIPAILAWYDGSPSDPPASVAVLRFLDRFFPAIAIVAGSAAAVWVIRSSRRRSDPPGWFPGVGAYRRDVAAWRRGWRTEQLAAAGLSATDRDRINAKFEAEALPAEADDARSRSPSVPSTVPWVRTEIGIAGRANAWRRTMPIVSGVILGGGLVLAYSLLLFLPYAGMLNDVAGHPDRARNAPSIAPERLR